MEPDRGAESPEPTSVTAAFRAGADLPRHEVERLLQSATGRSRAGLATGGDLAADEFGRFRELLARRRRGEPLQYIEGVVPFGPVELLVDERALVPRPETEYLWELAVAAVEGAPPAVIVDLCTGSGNLALALKHRFPAATVYASDLSRPALALAGENAATAGLDVEFRHGDLFEALDRSLQGRVDLIVCNPPYLGAGELSSLPVDVRDHEPHVALVAGPRGDEVIARIAVEARTWLREGGRLLCEIGERQGAVARELFASWAEVDIRPDLAGVDRIVMARR